MQVPSAWRVQVDDQRFEVSAEWIRAALIEWRANPSRDKRDQLARRLMAIRVESARYLESSRNASAERARLRSIDTQVLRILEDLSAGRQDLVTEIRQDIAGLAEALRQVAARGRY